MINRLEMSITQRVENTTNIYNEVSSRSERVGEPISLQNEKREQFESPAPDLGRPYSTEVERADAREALLLYWSAIELLTKLAEQPANEWSP